MAWIFGCHCSEYTYLSELLKHNFLQHLTQLVYEQYLKYYQAIDPGHHCKLHNGVCCQWCSVGSRQARDWLISGSRQILPSRHSQLKSIRFEQLPPFHSNYPMLSRSLLCDAGASLRRMLARHMHAQTQAPRRFATLSPIPAEEAVAAAASEASVDAPPHSLVCGVDEAGRGAVVR